MELKTQKEEKVKEENLKEEEDILPNLKIKLTINPSLKLYKSLDYYVAGKNKILYNLFYLYYSLIFH